MPWVHLTKALYRRLCVPLCTPAPALCFKNAHCYFHWTLHSLWISLVGLNFWLVLFVGDMVTVLPWASPDLILPRFSYTSPNNTHLCVQSYLALMQQCQGYMPDLAVGGNQGGSLKMRKYLFPYPRAAFVASSVLERWALSLLCICMHAHTSLYRPSEAMPMITSNHHTFKTHIYMKLADAYSTEDTVGSSLHDLRFWNMDVRKAAFLCLDEHSVARLGEMWTMNAWWLRMIPVGLTSISPSTYSLIHV